MANVTPLVNIEVIEQKPIHGAGNVDTRLKPIVRLVSSLPLRQPRPTRDPKKVTRRG